MSKQNIGKYLSDLGKDKMFLNRTQNALNITENSKLYFMNFKSLFTKRHH